MKNNQTTSSVSSKARHTAYRPSTQLDLFADQIIPSGENVSLWTPRDIWVRANQRLLEMFSEDRRVERKRSDKIQFDALATYFSAFSNTPDGGMIVFGQQDNGEITGCGNLSVDILNRIESCHLNLCPLAKPEFKRIPVVVHGRHDFCLTIFVPYIGVLVETNKGEAWVRYGEDRHKMSDEEKRDFRSTRRELSFELGEAIQKYPSDFDLRIIQDFCDSFRGREQKHTWTNNEILSDRHLIRRDEDKFVALNSLVLLAAKDPGLTIPGCRVRIQKFAGEDEGSGETYARRKEKTIEGNLVKIIKEADGAISELIDDVTWLNTDGKFITTPEYPRWAWFEALVNACVHRSYEFSGTEIFVKIFSDRMEIESPGGFVPPVNEKTIYSVRSSRNWHLMDALRFLGYVHMSREGTRRMRESMAEWGLPEPSFKQEAIHGVVVKVTLRNDHLSRKRSTDRDVALYFGVETWKLLEEHEIKIAAYAYRNGQIQVSEAQRVTGRSWGTSKKDLNRLVKKGVLIFEPGKFIRDPKAAYKLKGKEEDNE
ncbi:ATP-binding protein [Methylocystis sp. Sn-Cys]|uniref:ATP-binding protein n=1 Tax=Methylocystis sp. Sn-Cys TaxID=1701263 RepID=UPI0019233B86|nr:ATP-binding protein [Methylocystis sp. Sn-Cys]MBL1257880.1 putative DNA binding domain-containing protein [Methylocystis sp. Sn-Cys]